MRRCSLLVPLVIIALLGLLVGSSPVAHAIAQDSTPEGTPSAEGEFGLEGVSFEPLAVTSGVSLPSQADLVLVRFSLEPGAVLPSDPNDPTLAMVLIEAGEFTVEFDMPFTVTRAGTFVPALATAEAGGAFVAPEETVAAGEVVTLQVGDVAVFPPNVGGETRNDGEERLVGLAFLVSPPTEGGAVPAEGTPEGTPVVGTPTS